MLKIFVQVARRGSFSDAAASMQISKSKCSKLVSSLENNLGAILLERTTRRVNLTPCGEKYLAEIIPLLEEFDAVNKRASLETNILEDRIKIAAPSCIAGLFLWPMIERLMEAEPTLAFSLMSDASWMGLKRRTADCVVVFDELHVPNGVMLREQPIGINVVARSDYLSKHGIPRHPEDLNSHRCLIQSGLIAGNSFRFTGTAQAGKVECLEPYFVASDGRLVRDAVLAGKGVAFLPDYLVHADLASSG